MLPNPSSMPVLRGGARSVAIALFLFLVVAAAAVGQRVPGGEWMRYVDVEEAGFDPRGLEAARSTWEGLPSSAFMVVADGAVVAAWGDVDRRFMCHSVRKSFLSALYGIYWDRGEIALNKRMSDLGIDDYPDPLLDSEREARILDLLKARSGVFHPAAYAGRTDSRPRGSEGPGRYFAYNNWDFNTLATILMQETGEDVFEAFDEYFGGPLGMEDWRVSDGYYHYERDKSRYPAYPFRLSARDAARFGLLYAREGLWGDDRILSKHWVRRSSALYSIDNDIVGYGFMWWVYREPRFDRYGMYSALGVGNQMIAVLPQLDMVVVNRADTYEGEGTPLRPLLDLIEQVLEARTGAPAADAALVPLEVEPDPLITSAPDDALEPFIGEWAYPPASLGLPDQTTVDITLGDGHLVGHSPVSGRFKLYLQPDGTLHEEDSLERYWPITGPDGGVTGIADATAMVRGALVAAGGGDIGRARAMAGQVDGHAGLLGQVGRAVIDLLADEGSPERHVRGLLERNPVGAVAGTMDAIGSDYVDMGMIEPGIEVLELNTRIFRDRYRAWNSLGEAYDAAGDQRRAIRAFERVLELDPDNQEAREALAELGSEN